MTGQIHGACIVTIAPHSRGVMHLPQDTRVHRTLLNYRELVHCQLGWHSCNRRRAAPQSPIQPHQLALKLCLALQESLMLLGTLLFSSCSLVPRGLVLSDKPELHIMQLPLQLVVCVISTSVLRRSKAASKSFYMLPAFSLAH